MKNLYKKELNDHLKWYQQRIAEQRRNFNFIQWLRYLENTYCEVTCFTALFKNMDIRSKESRRYIKKIVGMILAKMNIEVHQSSELDAYVDRFIFAMQLVDCETCDLVKIKRYRFSITDTEDKISFGVDEAYVRAV